MAFAKATRLPPGCGLDLKKPLFYNAYQVQFHEARRQRFCSTCKKVVVPPTGTLRCPECQMVHLDNRTFPRIFKSLHLRAGRRSGKSLAGAHAVREELSIPDQRWWVCGPTFKVLHDSTMPTLLRLIPPEWVLNWNQDNLELELLNHSMLQFRSLDDPERARGMGLHGVWLDEAAFTPERAWVVMEPTLSENAGVVISTTSPGGFDWTYKEFYKRAVIDHRPGYWAARYRTIDNPLFQQSDVLRQEIENARQTRTPEDFAAEYLGDDVNFTGAIYGRIVDDQTLETDEAVQKLIPEWPNISPDRTVLIGLDEGSDHPFGANLLVIVPGGIVVVEEYLERMQAMLTHLAMITARFGTNRFRYRTWSANKNAAQLRLEFGLRGIGVVPAESAHEVGIQRVQSWLLTKQLWFVASRVPKTIEQMRSYRYADNYSADGQKRQHEQVYKKDDELPDAIRYALMAWPELPTVAAPMSEREQKRWDAMDERTRMDVKRWTDFEKQERSKKLERDDPSYPIGDFFNTVASPWD